MDGNRGILHEGREIVRSHAGDLWITCALEFRGRHRELWLPNRWTPLFFHDEAVAFAAGHRPCGECRHGEYQAYKAAWAEAAGGPSPSAREMNRRLHSERIVRGTHRRRRHGVPWRELPEGAFVVHEDTPCLVLEGELVAWGLNGYGSAADARPAGPPWRSPLRRRSRFCGSAIRSRSTPRSSPNGPKVTAAGGSVAPKVRLRRARERGFKMAIVNKDQLAKSVAERTGLNTSQAKLALEATLEEIGARLGAGDEVRLTGFGKFSVSNRAAREGRNPQTGATMQIPAKRVPKFGAGADLKNAVE